MPGFTQVFGGTTIAPANATFLSLSMSADVALAWPIEQAINGNVVADTIEVIASAPGLNIDIPDARQVTSGYTTCFNNTGSNTVTVRNAVGANILSLVSGTAWVIYLADNSTEGGTWRTFQLGASVSVAVAAALAGAGLRAITTTLNQDIPVTSFAATPTTLLDSDRAKLMNWTGGLGTLNLPSAGVVGNGWFVQVRNSGSGDLTVTPPAGTIDGSVSKTFAAGTSAVVVTDGTNYFTLGFGSGAGGGGTGFDFVEINVAGSGNFTLSGVNLNRVAYRFIGVLTGNRTIIVPNAIQQYWVANATTGAFSLFVRTAGQTPPGIEVLQNNQGIMYCDGTNVIDAESSTVSFPIPVAQGGTGAVTAATARTNLGATATGSSLFTAADAAAGRTALGATATGTAVFTAADAAAARTAIGISLPLAIASGGTGATTAASARTNLGSTAVGDAVFTAVDAAAARTAIGVSLPLAIASGGTGATTAGAALTNLGAVPTTRTLTAGTGLTGGGDLSANRSFAVDFTNAAFGIPPNSQAGNYTAVLADANTMILHPSGGGAGDTFTIPSNASVPYALGTFLQFTNRDSNAISIAITTDTLIFAGSTATGTRALSQNGIATAQKIESTVWLISGTGLT